MVSSSWALRMVYNGLWARVMDLRPDPIVPIISTIYMSMLLYLNLYFSFAYTLDDESVGPKIFRSTSLLFRCVLPYLYSINHLIVKSAMDFIQALLIM